MITQLGKKRKRRKPTRDGYKWCTGCDKEFPANLDSFYKCGLVKSGLSSKCKKCRDDEHREYREKNIERYTEYDKRYYEKNRVQILEKARENYTENRDAISKRRKKWRDAQPDYWKKGAKRKKEKREQRKRQTLEWQMYLRGLKQCTLCKAWKPTNLDYFHARQTRKGGLTSRCKQCRNRQNKSKYNPSPEELTRKALYQAKRRASRTPAQIEYNRQKKKKWVNKNRDKAQGYVRNRRARTKAVPGTHTPAQIQEQLKRQKYHCYYAACGFAKFKKVKGKYVYEVEHTFPLSRVVGTGIPANDMGYLVLACPLCNDKKQNKFPHEWFEGGRLL